MKHKIPFFLLLVSLSVFFAACGKTKKSERHLTEAQADQLTDELTAEICAEYDTTLQMIRHAYNLISEEGIQTEYEAYPAAPSHLSYKESKAHLVGGYDYDFSRLLFLVCNDLDSLSHPHPGKKYDGGSLSNRDFEEFSLPVDLKRCVGFGDSLKLREIIKHELNFYYTLREDASMDSVKQEVKNNLSLYLDDILPFDHIVFIHLEKYMAPCPEPLSPENELTAFPLFRSGYMKSHVVVGDLHTGLIKDQFKVENANSDTINYFYSGVGTPNTPTEQAMNHNESKARVESLYHNLIFTLRLHLWDQLAKRGFAPKREEQE